MRRTLCALALAILPLAAGCSGPFNPDTDTGPGGLPINTPLNDTPNNTMLRFEATYEYQALPEYQNLFAQDFLFTFSGQSDADLVAQYGLTWGKDDEIESTSHLFDGFTNSGGTFVSPASQITLTLNGPQIIDDPTRPDSAAFYKYVIVPSIRLDLEVPGTDGFTIQAPHDFYLVRGDVALLDATQQATADRWYIRRWDDKSPPIAGARAPQLSSLGSFGGSGNAAQVTWGLLKSSYVSAP